MSRGNPREGFYLHPFCWRHFPLPVQFGARASSPFHLNPPAPFNREDPKPGAVFGYTGSEVASGGFLCRIMGVCGQFVTVKCINCFLMSIRPLVMPAGLGGPGTWLLIPAVVQQPESTKFPFFSV